jgi:hypothetical protein
LEGSTFEDGIGLERAFAEGAKARTILEENGSRVTKVFPKGVE